MKSVVVNSVVKALMSEKAETNKLVKTRPLSDYIRIISHVNLRQMREKKKKT